MRWSVCRHLGQHSLLQWQHLQVGYLCDIVLRYTNTHEQQLVQRLTPAVHLCSNKELLQHRKYAAGKAFGASPNVSGISAPCTITKGAFSNTGSNSSRDAERIAPEAHTQPAPVSPAGGTVQSLDVRLVESDSCEKPKLQWQLLPRHGCTVKEMVCVDQVGLQS